MRQEDETIDEQPPIPVNKSTTEAGQKVLSIEAPMPFGSFSMRTTEGAEGDRNQLEIMYRAEDKRITVVTQENGFGYVLAQEGGSNPENKGMDRDTSAEIARLGRGLLLKGSPLQPAEVDDFAEQALSLTDAGVNREIMNSLTKSVLPRQ